MGAKKLSEKAAEAEKWFGDNKASFEALGASGMEIFEGIGKLFTNRAVATAQKITGYDDVDAILFDAQKIDKAMEESGINMDELLDAVAVAVKFAVSAAVLIGV